MILLLALLQGDAEALRFFEERIRPLLVDRCYDCHSASTKKLKGGLRVDTRAGLLAGGNSGPALVPGQPDASLLLRAIRHDDAELRMPPKEKLPPGIVADVERWIRNGAFDPRIDAGPRKDVKPLWSIQPLHDAPPPEVRDRAWPRSPIDRFILAALEAKQLRPSPPASKPALLRRASFDLTGLPPTLEENAAFLADASPEAFRNLVDRLLASPAYGERWGRHWLDTVHFGETHGYDKDKKRPNAWPYRDYVIRALNEDRPYPRFVQEQIAGDRLFPGDPEAETGLGFLAAGPWDFVGHVELPESKTDGLIARYNDRDDMLSTVVSTFQSLTLHCARCHDHKFDPLPQEDYYALQAVFAGVDRADRVIESDPVVGARRRALQADLAALDGPSPTNGWHSGIESSPDREQWVEVDLERDVEIDEVRLIPARPTDFKDTPGFGFPVRYRVDLDGEPIADHSAEGRPNPGNKPVVFPAGRRGRRLRVTATLLWERSNDFVFALAELEIFAAGVNVAAGKPVYSPNSIEAGRWGVKGLVDGYDSRERLGNVARRTELRAALAALPPPKRVYAATNMFQATGGFQPAKTPRAVNVLARGDVKRPLRPAAPGALSCLPGPTFSCADPSDEGQRRAALARWLTDPANVLLRRSIVNRVWQYHFGRGIVETPNDFGRMGAEPSHPLLLDWLARWFQDNGESLKSLHRLILNSAVWQQSSGDNPAARTVDAENRLLWRMDRRRLDAESFRDAMLAAGGDLDPRRGGPSDEHFLFKDDHSPVYDYTRFDPASPAARRRSVYRLGVRSVPDPFFDALDAADASILTPRRNSTLSALQALAALNDPFVLHRCSTLAARIRTAPDPVDLACRLVWGRPPEAAERALLDAFAQRQGLEHLARVLFNSNAFVFVD